MNSQNYPSMDQYNYGQQGQQGQPMQQHMGGMPQQQQQWTSPPNQQQQQQWGKPPAQQYPNQQPFQRDIPQQYASAHPQYSPPGAQNPDFIANLSNNPLTQVGLNYGLTYGQSLFSDGKQYVDSNFGKYFSFSTLKSYFNVNTSYVFNKIKLLLFPFRQKTWKRRIIRQGDLDQYLPPRDDINAPDLYIPMMAFVTYYLLYGFQLGMSASFSPDKLGASISKGIIIWLLELGLFKLGFFFTNSYSIPMYDMISYSGYKYVLLVLSTAVTILFGGAVTWGACAYISICIGIFIVKTLRVVLLSDNIHSDMHNPEGGTKRNYFVVMIAILQALLCWVY
ncbi:hypothetical protein SAMD00019534_055610 [Acytostelium subglobosum LB1]|uniref:hypothetical protein n=1 Tax=Acytostelium subglobosum LB1 TaxID=1410327 RepID=UPI00064517F6|nr:hypothetical protein SAMD00019534_055610 [Acytostelium subglobosum LB1]GAM22386.1 hypothetical protein SAMD00019534_055610 [Acytostelium subglobosum LB1]|eukprot:XP_012754506.1 hypothetical protein SAMD00019534_055610 [Acytostelium subglobosum LB1]